MKRALDEILEELESQNVPDFKALSDILRELAIYCHHQSGEEYGICCHEFEYRPNVDDSLQHLSTAKLLISQRNGDGRRG